MCEHAESNYVSTKGLYVLLIPSLQMDSYFDYIHNEELLC